MQLILERKGGGEERREREGDVREILNWLSLIRTPTRDRARQLGMHPDQESNPQQFGLWDKALINGATPNRAYVFYLYLSFFIPT